MSGRTYDVAYSPRLNAVIDAFMDDGRSQFARETIEEIRVRYPDVVVKNVDAAVAAIEDAARSEPTRISKEQFEDALEMLPPRAWVRNEGTETFKFEKRLCGSITSIYCRIAGEYWTFNDRITLSHNAIVNRVRAAIAQGVA